MFPICWEIDCRDSWWLVCFSAYPLVVSRAPFRAIRQRSVMSPDCYVFVWEFLFASVILTDKGFKLHSYLWKLKLMLKLWKSSSSSASSSQGRPSGPIICLSQGWHKIYGIEILSSGLSLSMAKISSFASGLMSIGKLIFILSWTW